MTSTSQRETILEARNAAVKGIRNQKSEQIKEGVKTLTKLVEETGNNKARDVLGTILQLGLNNDSTVVKVFAEQDARPALTIRQIVDLTNDQLSWVLRCLQDTGLGPVTSEAHEPRSGARAFDQAMLRALLSSCKEKQEGLSTFLDGVRAVSKRQYVRLVESVDEAQTLSDSTFMEYGLTLSPTVEVARSIQQRTEEEVRDYPQAIYEALWRGNDEAVQFILQALPSSESIIQAEHCALAVKADPALTHAGSAQRGYKSSPLSEETALRLVRHRGGVESSEVLVEALNRYSFAGFTRVVDQFEGPEPISNLFIRGQTTLPRIEYLLSNLSLQQPYQYFNRLLGNNPGQADELWKNFVEKRSPEQRLDMLAEAVEEWYTSILQRVPETFDLEAVPDSEAVDDKTMQKRMPAPLGQLLLEKAVEDWVVAVDDLYPECGSFRAMDDDVFETVRASGQYTELLRQAEEHDPDDYENLRTRFGPDLLNTPLEGTPDWQEFEQLVEHNPPLPSNSSALRKMLEAGYRAEAKQSLAETESMKAEVAYKLVLYDNELFEVLCEQYSFTTDTTVRAVNNILTHEENEVYLPSNERRLERLKRFDGAVEVDYNHTPSGTDELGLRPLKTIVGYPHRPADRRRSEKRRTELPDGSRIDLIQTLVELGADPDEISVIEEALRYGRFADVLALCEAGFDSPRAVSEEAVVEARPRPLRIFAKKAGPELEGSQEFARGIIDQLSSIDWALTGGAISKGLFEDCTPPSDALCSGVYDSFTDHPHDPLVALVVTEFLRQRPDFLPPQRAVTQLPDGLVRTAIIESLPGRARRAIEHRPSQKQLR